jgi:hypothetical protein
LSKAFRKIAKDEAAKFFFFLESLRSNCIVLIVDGQWNVLAKTLIGIYICRGKTVYHPPPSGSGGIIIDVIQILNQNKATGPDKISHKMLKIFPEKIAKPPLII